MDQECETCYRPALYGPHIHHYICTECDVAWKGAGRGCWFCGSAERSQVNTNYEPDWGAAAA